MEAVRRIAQVKNGMLTLSMPESFNELEVEVIVLPSAGTAISPTPIVPRPSPAIAGKGRILGDIMAPAVPEDDWNVLKEPAA